MAETKSISMGGAQNLTPFAPASGLCNVIVESPAGSRAKYKFEASTGLFRLHKYLPRGWSFPFEFGFIPGTRAEDDDPIDVCGKTIRNDRLVAAAQSDKIQPTERTLEDLPDKLLDQIEQFFISYNVLEGRVFKVLARRGPGEARALLERAVQNAEADGRE